MKKGKYLISLKALEKKSKASLLRLIMKHLKQMPKKRLAMLTYEISKTKLGILRSTKRKALPKRKTKRKFSKKQLAAQRLFTKRAKAGTLRKRRR